MLLEEDPAGHQRSGGSLIVEVGLVSSFMWASTVDTKLLRIYFVVLKVMFFLLHTCHLSGGSLVPTPSLL